MKQKFDAGPAYFVQKIIIRLNRLFSAKGFIKRRAVSKIQFINQTVPKICRVG